MGRRGTQISSSRVSSGDHRGRVVVVGAGIAGMSAALYLLKAGFDVTVLEGNDHVGGKFGAVRKAGAVHEHAYHFLGDWCVNFWTVVTEIGLNQNDHFRRSRGVGFLRPGADRPVPDRLSLLSLGDLRTRFTEGLYSGVVPPDDMILWFYSFLELIAHGRDLDEKEFLNRISVNGFMRSLPYMTDLAALLHQEALMKAFAIPSFDTSARSYRRFARFFSQDQDGFILGSPVDDPFWRTFHRTLRTFRRPGVAGDAAGPAWPVRFGTTLEKIDVTDTSGGPRVSAIHVARGGVRERWPNVEHLVVTVPPEDLVSIVEASPALRAVAPGLLQLRNLRSKKMPSLDLYFREGLPDIPSHHVTLIDDGEFVRRAGDRGRSLVTHGNRIASRFALSFVDNRQAWFPRRKDETWLNVVSADFEELEGLDKDEAKETLIAELQHYVGFERWQVDDTRSDLQLNTKAKLFTNTVGSWQHRPEPGLYADPQRKATFTNLYLAGDYCRSAVDIVCLEGAILTARTAACAVAERAHAKGSVAEPEVPADVSDRKVRRLMQDLDPWLRLAARVGFGAGSRLDPSGRSPLAASGLRARARRLGLSR